MGRPSPATTAAAPATGSGGRASATTATAVGTGSGGKGGANSAPAGSKGSGQKPGATGGKQDDLFEKPKRPPKGHRQKGAGTVVVSKGDLTVGGLVIKEWQRTPVQMLHEYCQANKRPNPRYDRLHNSDGGGQVRYRVVLQDPKRPGSEKDLLFTPEQSFDGDDPAKHAAAMLALHHLVPDRPLEGKLPEPYRTIWLGFSAASTAKPTGASAKAAAAAPAPKAPPKGAKAAVAAAAPAVASTAAIAVTPAAGSAAAPAPSSGLFREDDYALNDVKVPAPAPAVPVITAKAHFASQYERRMATEKRRIERAEAQHEREKHQVHIPVVQVFMGDDHREYVEALLKQVGLHEVAGESKAISEETATAMAERLVGMGFSIDAAQAAVAACGDDLTAVLDYLCLHVPESDLPEAFHPRAQQVDIIGAVNTSTAAALQYLLQLGFSKVDCMQALSESKHDVAAAAALLYRKLCAAADVDVVDASDTPVADSDEQLNEEMEVLAAVFGDDVRRTEPHHGHWTVHVELGTADGVPGSSAVEFVLQQGHYPAQPPIVWFENSVIAPELRLSCTLQLAKLAQSLAGSPCMYQIASHAQRDLELVSSGVPRNVLVTQAAPIKSVPPPILPASKTAAKPTSTRAAGGGRGRQRTQAKPPIPPSPVDSAPFINMQRVRSRLPAASFKEEFCKLMDANRVVLISGATGCGKTTQIPQFILEHMVATGHEQQVNILCTQPRRIAAIGVAERVADERCERIGETVGYQIRGDKKASAATRLLFCTTGVLLRQLQAADEEEGDDPIRHVSHIVIDEIHERSMETDFVLALLRKMLHQYRDLKVVLMSATMDAERFAAYFQKTTSAPCPILSIPGFTHPVEEKYLDEVYRSLGMGARKRTMRAFRMTDAGDSDLTALPSSYIIDIDLLADFVQHLVSTFTKTDEAILVFLPGVAEIQRLVSALSGQEKIWPLALHGALPTVEQRKVFQRAPAGKFKVVAATNVAETSITIDDITVVVDTGRVREMLYDPMKQMSVLAETWTSQASSRQRRGRAGRVRPGTCYRLFPRSAFNMLPEFTIAEVLRVPLDRLVLQALSMNVADLGEFLNNMLDCPSEAAFATCVKRLTELGAMTPEQRLTPLGKHLARLPIEATLGKMLVYGCMLRCVDACLSIAGLMCERSPFLPPRKRDADNDSDKDDNEDDSGPEAPPADPLAPFKWANSDFLTAVKAFNKWRDLGSTGAKRDFCRQHNISFDTMCKVDDLRDDFAALLYDAGLLSGRAGRDSGAYGERAAAVNEYSESVPVIQGALCAGLWPHIACAVKPKRYTAVSGGTVEASVTAQEIKYFTMVNGSRLRVFMHPSSVNFSQNEYRWPWLLYHEIVETSKHFIRHSSMVSPYALLLFGGAVNVQHEDGTISVGNNQFVKFHAAARVGVLVKKIRQGLDLWLDHMLVSNGADSSTHAVDAVLRLLASEGHRKVQA